MHSSRMRTACLLTVSQHALGGGGGLCVSQHALGRGGVCPRLWTEWQTGVKTLPCRNFVAGGKNLITSRHLRLYLSFWANCTSLKTNYHMTNLSQQFHLHHNFICTSTIHTRNGNKQMFLCHIYCRVCYVQFHWVQKTHHGLSANYSYSEFWERGKRGIIHHNFTLWDTTRA